jgi:glycosyltransferase involved in cell wall biosynthesis
VSVLEQEHVDVELIVIDGGSTDATVEVLEQYDADLAFWCSSPDDGQADAIGRGMQRATGDVVNWLNADDLLLTGALDAVAQAVGSEAGQPAVYVGGAITIDQQGRTIRQHPPQHSVGSLVPVAPPIAGGVQASVFMSRTAWDLAGGIDRHLHYAMDIDLQLRCAEAAVPFFAIDDDLAAYRAHPGAKTTSYWRSSVAEKRAVYSRRLDGVERKIRRVHGPRLRRHLASLCLGPITPQTPLPERLRRIGHAVREQPDLAVRPREVRRLARLATFGR